MGACIRLVYPYELEWMEGGMIDHVIRMMDGLPLYVKPSIEFVPFIYPPFFFYTASLFSIVIGEGFVAARLVSLLATVGSLLLLYHIVTNETKDKLIGLVVAGLFAATYEASGAWFDLARVDSLFLFLFLAAVYVLRFKPTAKGLLLSGLLLTLSYLTKQTALAMIAPLLMYSIWRLRICSLWIVLSCVIGITTVTGLLNYWSDGWYYYYIFEIPGKHSWDLSMFASFWSLDILGVIPILLAYSVLYLFKPTSASTNDSRFFYGIVFFSMVGAAWLGRLHTGGYLNVLMTAHLSLALVTGLGLWALLKQFENKPTVRAIAYAAIAVQFWMLGYAPSKYVPTDIDRQAMSAFVQATSEIEGDVFIPYHGYVGRLAGKGSYCHKMAVGDVIRSDSTVGAELMDEIHLAYRNRLFSAVILDAGWSADHLKIHYTNTGGVFTDPNLGYPMTGFRTRPRYFFVPRESLQGR